MIDAKFSSPSPFILLDIGGATTDIHYSKDLVDDNIVTENEYDRLVSNASGVYKSRQSLILAAQSNEFVYELLFHLKVTENIFQEQSDKATKVLMQLAIFLVLCKMSHHGTTYVNLKLLAVNSIVMTGGITKVLTVEEIETIIAFFYKKILTSDHNPTTVLDSNYDIVDAWGQGEPVMSINCIRAVLEDTVQAHSDKPAIVFNDKRLTYAELFKRVDQVAFYLKELGLPKNSRIGVYSNKGVEQVIAILAILSTDYVLVPLTKLLKPEQVEYIINDCDIKCIITDKLKLESIEEIDFDGISFPMKLPAATCHPSKKSTSTTTSPYSCDINGHDNAVITYSFGLTGKPKGIVISHRNLIDSARVVSQYINLQQDDIISGLLIFNLDYGLNQIFCALYKGATLALHRMILPEDFFNHLINDKVTVLPLMPVNISQIFDEDLQRLPSAELFDSLRIITSSGGNVTPKMIKDCKQSFRKAAFLFDARLDRGLSLDLPRSIAGRDPPQFHRQADSRCRTLRAQRRGQGMRAA